MMIKNFLFAAALLSLAFAGGCAKGGSGPCAVNCPGVTIADSSGGFPGVTQAGVTLPITFTATTTPPQTAVTWSITGNACSGTGNPCGSFTSTTSSTANYVGPSAVPSDPSIAIVATFQSDSSVSGSFSLKIVPITTAVAPSQLNIGQNLTQQFTSVALPDNAPQTFTWTCTANGVACANFHQDANVSGLAYYTAQDSCGSNCVQISTVANTEPDGCTVGTCTIGKASIVSSRLSVNSTYAFQFSGYDNNDKLVSVAGTFTTDKNGAVVSGVEDEISWNGSQYSTAKHSITGGGYTPITSSDPNSNNSGTLTLTNGTFPNKFQVVLNAAGDIQMIESDGHGTGSGAAQISAPKNFNTGDQTYAFGFTGVDSSGNRVGYAGLMPIDGALHVTGGMMDTNDNGNTANICGASPCSVAGGYAYNQTTNLGTFTLTSPPAMNFDFFVAGGSTSANNPLTLYAISTDPVDATHPAVLGTMQLQDSKQTYNNAAFKSVSVSALTGANANVSLTLGITDGNGHFTGGFDQNNNGTMVSVPDTPGFTYTYAANSTPNGRYTFQMLGVPGTNPQPLTFILYASGANRGFLLDQSTSAVITGTMTPQGSKAIGSFANSGMTGTYAVATNGNSASSIAPLTMNLVLTSPGAQVYNVAGTENVNQAVTGKYDIKFEGVGTIGLTAPATADYIIYGVDQTDFFMIIDGSKDKGVASPILFAAQ